MRVVDLFSGCGGMSRGFESEGFEIVLGVEHWEPARNVYKNNFAAHVSDLDLNDVHTAVGMVKKLRPDVIIGGPPCQEFSPAGSRIEGDRAALTVKFAEIVSKVRPIWFVIENVQAIKKSSTWSAAKVVLESAGYGMSEVVLNAAYFGVPQLRKRFFAVGRLGEKADFLSVALERKISELPISLSDYLGDEFGIRYYYRHPRTWGRRGVFSVDEPSPTVRSTNRRVPPGYTAHPSDAGSHLTARPLTPLERARVQTFDKSFKFLGFDTWKDMMIANAVPVDLARHVARAMKSYESSFIDDKTKGNSRDGWQASLVSQIALSGMY